MSASEAVVMFENFNLKMSTSEAVQFVAEHAKMSASETVVYG